MEPLEMFLGLTATGWTAIGSIAGALSILILCIYNSAYLATAIKRNRSPAKEHGIPG